MYSNKITPLRTCIGKALPIAKVSVHDIAVKAANFQFEAGKLNALTEAENRDYSPFQPQSLPFSGTQYTPAPGMNDYILPGSKVLPFANTDNGAYIFGLLPNAVNVKSRDLWIELEISLPKKATIGGIALSGFPHLFYQINKHGENSSNFGLPREIKIKWEDGQKDFLDNENVFIRQEPVSHSGIHYLNFGPVVSDKIILRLADWPEFMTSVLNKKPEKKTEEGKDKKDGSDSKKEKDLEKYKNDEIKSEKEKVHEKDKDDEIKSKKENNKADCGEEVGPISCNPDLNFDFGLLIPFMTIYEYKESAFYQAELPMGLLACTQSPALTQQQYFCGKFSEKVGDGESINADYVYFMNSPDKTFVKFSAAASLDQARRFTPGNSKFPEFFISVPFANETFINLYLEQAHDYPRCVSGIKIKFPEKILKGIMERQKLYARVYEIDVTEGLSPLMVSDRPETKKYLTLVYEGTLSKSGYNFTLPFVRASLAKYFLVCFRHILDPDSKEKQIITSQLAIDQIDFIQSAHISITTRAAHNLLVDSLHFRIIGENLAEDYSRIGTEGFSICVESMIGANKKSVLFEAHSLLELLNAGNTRLFSNMRREEVKVDVSRETTDTLADSYDEHRTLTNNENWRRSETGEDVKWNPTIGNGLNERNEKIAEGFAKNHMGPFENYSSSELRTYNELIGHEGVGSYAGRIRVILTEMFQGTGISFPENIFTQDPKLLRPDESGFNWKTRIWNKGFDTAKENFWISELRSLTLPPWTSILSTATLDDVKSMIENIASMVNSGGIPNLPDMNALMNLLNAFTPFALVNGLAIGGSLGVQVGAGGSVSASTAQLLPSMNYSSTSGTSGSIAKQGTKTGYAYSQYRTQGQDITRIMTEYERGKMNRKVTRLLNQPGTLKERKKGVEVMWQNKITDIVSGRIPLGISFLATGSNYYQNADMAVRIKFPGYTSQLDIDFWFEVTEESIKEDY